VDWIKLAWNKQQEKNLLNWSNFLLFQSWKSFYQLEKSRLREIAA